MGSAYRVIATVGCLLVSLCAGAQVGDSARKIVLPNPQLIHCRSAECSQLWKKDSGDTASYPAQVLTDVVNGEVVGVTAVYDKSVSMEELRSAIETLYPKDAIDGPIGSLWRVEAEQLVIQLSDRKGGTKQLIYLKIVKNDGASSLVPSVHIIDPSK